VSKRAPLLGCDTWPLRWTGVGHAASRFAIAAISLFLATMFPAEAQSPVDSDPVFFTGRSQIVQMGMKHQLPAVCQAREFVEIGGLMSYGDNVAHRFRRAAAYVDKILKGTRPGDLPVEQATKFELVPNLKTAQQLGLTLPPSVLVRADDVIQ
jgi:putative tryptophan/tyrosine transport system substrate-binding protein